MIGQDFLPGEILSARMSGFGGTWELGRVATGSDGHFAVVFAVPADASPGPYAVDAISASGIIARADFEVDDVAPRPALTPTPEEVAVAVAVDSVEDTIWVYAPLALVVIAVFMFARFIRRGRPDA